MYANDDNNDDIYVTFIQQMQFFFLKTSLMLDDLYTVYNIFAAFHATL